uniref:Uncharacterized protein n=1 Tax=Sipha flava TaxID=143950 RepID=A0A2S2R9N0_9HEMI
MNKTCTANSRCSTVPRHSGILLPLYYIHVELVPVHRLLQYYDIQMYGAHECHENTGDSKNDHNVQTIRARKMSKVLQIIPIYTACVRDIRNKNKTVSMIECVQARTQKDLSQLPASKYKDKMT